ncbi:hypothetical protein [Sinomonas atrocyanea]
MRRRLLTRTAGAAVGLLIGLGGTAALAAPASASATVQQYRYDDHSTFASTDTFSADGCDVVSRSAGTNSASGGAVTIYYASSHFNKCTGQTFYSVWGQGPTDIYDVGRNSVRAVATLPLSDGSHIHLDLTWQGIGPVEHTVSTSVHVVPGVSVDRVTIQTTTQQATVTGTQTFGKANITASKGTGTHVSIGQP